MTSGSLCRPANPWGSRIELRTYPSRNSPVNSGVRLVSTEPGQKEIRMTRHIGIVACSAEGAALCYRTICAEAAQFMGEHNHPEITMHTWPLADYMEPVRQGKWQEVAQLMLSSARKVAGAGAEFAICPDNTIHQAFEFVVGQSPIPWLHIARAVAEEARTRSFTRLGILGTRYLMEGPSIPKHSESMACPAAFPRQAIANRSTRSYSGSWSTESSRNRHACTSMRLFQS